jgi:hypothetical protein
MGEPNKLCDLPSDTPCGDDACHAERRRRPRERVELTTADVGTLDSLFAATAKSSDANADSMKLWWLSYAGEEGFRGVVLVHASDFVGACRTARELGIGPGGQVTGDPAPDDVAKIVDTKWIGRCLSATEANELNAWLDQHLEDA